MNSIKVSAPGKLLLFGDHAVVYNRPCIATALNQRMYLTAELREDKQIVINAPDVGLDNYTKEISQLTIGDVPKGAEYVEYCVKNICEKYNISTGVTITTESDFNALVGFGSSSASAVCTVKALSELFKLNLSNKDIFDLAYKAVIDIKGIGSGYDIACAIYGGVIYFVTGGKIIENIEVPNLNLVVGYTGIKADTASIVKDLAKRFENYQEVRDTIFDNITSLVEKAKVALIENNFEKLGFYMNINEGYLESLGVGSKILSNLIYSSREVGALGAKLSGAGVGDCMIALTTNENKVAIINAIESNGGKYIDIATNSEGVRVEK